MENKYYLAIETKPKNYFPINLLDLDISNKFNTFKLDELDNFTLKYTSLEIKESIKRANLLDIENDMSLVVILYEKKEIRRLPALTKEYYYDMWQYIKDNYNSKLFLNKIVNFLNNLVDPKTILELKNINNREDYIKLISGLPYTVERKLYFYLNEKL